MTDSAEKMRKADRTRIFFDTEFIEDGKTIDLISIGMVRDDGETYYAESSDCDLSRADQWVKDNVIVHLRGGEALKSRKEIAADIVAFAGADPEFWAYYADYDWVVLCQLFGRMIDLPKGWPMFCRDLKQLAGDTVLPQQISTEHHALADAVWAAEAFAALSTKSDGGGESRPAETGTGGLASCTEQTTPATMPAQAGVAPGPSDPIPSQPDEREEIARIINPRAFDNPKYPASDDTMWREAARDTALTKAAAILAMQAERRGAEPRGCPTPGACSCPPAPIAGLEPGCPFCGRDPFHRIDNGIGMEAVAVTCCDLGDLFFRGARAAPSEVTMSWEEFMEIGHKIAVLRMSAAQLEAHAAEQVRAERERIAAWHDEQAADHARRGLAIKSFAHEQSAAAIRAMAAGVSLTKEQRHVMRSALGLNMRDYEYRNHFAASPADAKIWDGLCKLGFAELYGQGGGTLHLKYYHVTDAGRRALADAEGK